MNHFFKALTGGLVLSFTLTFNVYSAALLYEDFQSVIPGSKIFPSGWDYNIEVDMGVADAGTIDYGNGDIGAYCRGPSAPGSSNHVTMFGYTAATFTRENNLRCTFAVFNGQGSALEGAWAAPNEGIQGSWNDTGGAPGVHTVMPGGGPFHLPGTIAKAQADPSGLTNSGTGLFNSVKIIRDWNFADDGVGFDSRCDPWRPAGANVMSKEFHDAFRYAVNKQTAVYIRAWLDDSQGGWVEWSNDSMQTWNPDVDNSGTGCDDDPTVEIAFNTYAGAIIIDEVIVEDDNNIFDGPPTPPNQARDWSIYN